MIFTDEIMHNLHQRVLAELGEIPMPIAKTPDQYFSDLAEQIIGQQLSVKAADTIIARVKENLGGEFAPGKFLDAEHTFLRSLGMSNAKAQYVKNIAETFKNNSIKYHEFETYEDEKIIEELIKIKGIGRWTAEMFLMFTMARPDVFSVGDLMLRKMVVKHYGFKKEPKYATILRISKKWSPNRTLASRILWRSLGLKELF